MPSANRLARNPLASRARSRYISPAHESVGLALIARTRAIAVAVLFLSATSVDAQTLRWGGDAEGGAPYVEADPRDPSKVVGFDAEIAELIAK